MKFPTNPPQPKTGILNIQPYKQGKSAKEPTLRQVKLSSNENNYGPSPRALEAYDRASQSMARYPDGTAQALRQAIGDVHGIDPDHIVCGAGSDELIGLLINAYTNPGDEVLYPEHAFLMYAIYARSVGAKPVDAAERGLKANVDNLIARVTPRTKIVILANPNNPTGSYLTRSELQELRNRLPAHILLIVDAAYAECVEAEDCSDGQFLAETTANTVMLRTFSKVYGLAALRLGWMYASEDIVAVINRIRSPFNVSQIAQDVGIAAVKDVEYTAKIRQGIIQERARLREGVLGRYWKVAPSEGNFLLIDFGTLEMAQRVFRHLAEDEIFVRDVIAYKLPAYLRVSIGTSGENDRFLERLGQFQSGKV